MSDEDLADYEAHPDAYSGSIQPVQKKITDRYEFFEFFMECDKGLPRETLIERLAPVRDMEMLRSFSEGELLAEYCEGRVAAAEAAGSQISPGKGGA
jgi:hypothetical protein